MKMIYIVQRQTLDILGVNSEEVLQTEFSAAFATREEAEKDCVAMSEEATLEYRFVVQATPLRSSA